MGRKGRSKTSPKRTRMTRKEAAAKREQKKSGVVVERNTNFDSSGEFQRVQIKLNGENIGYVNFGVRNGVGHIQDTMLNDKARGKGLMKDIYPEVEKIMKAQGATSVKLETVHTAVGQKVWKPLGFISEGGGGSDGTTEYWRKKL